MYKEFLSKEKKTNDINSKNEDGYKILLNPGEKFEKLYSNFYIEKGPDDFWLNMDYQIKIPSIMLEKIHRNVDFLKNYQIIDDIALLKLNDNTNYKSNIKNKRRINNERNETKKYKTSLSYNNLIKTNNDSNYSFMNNNYNINLDENSVYDRLYNQGFYIKNKKIIKRIRSEENFKMEMKNSKIQTYKNVTDIYINKSNNKNRHNRTVNYFKLEETFKPKINKNSIRIVKNLKKLKLNNGIDISSNHSFNNDNNLMNIYKNYISKEYINLIKYNKNLKYKNGNNKTKKTNSQRIINLYKKGVEHYKKLQNDYNIKKEKDFKENYKTLKNNNDDFKIVYNYKIKNKKDKIYEKNIKWKRAIIIKNQKKKEIEEKKEINENKNIMNLTGKDFYEKFKNKRNIIFKVKEKINSYALLNKKNKTKNKYLNENEIKKKKNKIDSLPKNKNEKYKNNILYMNNEGKPLYLYQKDNIIFDNNEKVNNEKYNNNFKSKNNNNEQFLKLVKENKDFININNKNTLVKEKSMTLLSRNKNTLDYKINNIKKAFCTKNKRNKIKYY